MSKRESPRKEKKQTVRYSNSSPNDPKTEKRETPLETEERNERVVKWKKLEDHIGCCRIEFPDVDDNGPKGLLALGLLEQNTWALDKWFVALHGSTMQTIEIEDCGKTWWRSIKEAYAYQLHVNKVDDLGKLPKFSNSNQPPKKKAKQNNTNNNNNRGVVVVDNAAHDLNNNSDDYDDSDSDDDNDSDSDSGNSSGSDSGTDSNDNDIDHDTTLTMNNNDNEVQKIKVESGVTEIIDLTSSVPLSLSPTPTLNVTQDCNVVHIDAAALPTGNMKPHMEIGTIKEKIKILEEVIALYSDMGPGHSNEEKTKSTKKELIALKLQLYSSL